MNKNDEILKINTKIDKKLVMLISNNKIKKKFFMRHFIAIITSI